MLDLLVKHACLLRALLIAIAFDAFFSYASWAGVFLFVVSGYKSRIYESYDLPSSRAYSPGPLYASLAFWVLKLRSRDHAELATATVEEWRYILKEADSEIWAKKRTSFLQIFAKPESSRLRGFVQRRALSIIMYRRSLIPIIPSLAFMLSYSFTQAIDARWYWTTSLTVDTSMGFGQMTPLLLLILPVLAAGEIYQG
jgi:hypothetical protein